MATVEIKTEPLDDYTSNPFTEEELTIKPDEIDDYENCNDLNEEAQPEVQNEPCKDNLQMDKDLSEQNSIQSRDSIEDTLRNIKTDVDVKEEELSEPECSSDEVFPNENCMVFIPKEIIPMTQPKKKYKNGDLRIPNAKCLTDKEVETESNGSDSTIRLSSKKVIPTPKIVTQDTDFEAFAQKMLSGFTSDSYKGTSESHSLLKENLRKIKEKTPPIKVAELNARTPDGFNSKSEDQMYEVIVDSEGNTYKIKKENFTIDDSLKIKEEPLEVKMEVCDPEEEESEEDSDPPRMPLPLPSMKNESAAEESQDNDLFDFNNILEELIDRKAKSMAREKNEKGGQIQSSKSKKPIEHKINKGYIQKKRKKGPKKKDTSDNQNSVLKSTIESSKSHSNETTPIQLSTSETAPRKLPTLSNTSDNAPRPRKLLTLKNTTNFKHKEQNTIVKTISIDSELSKCSSEIVNKNFPPLEMRTSEGATASLPEKTDESMTVKYTSSKKTRKGWKFISDNEFDQLIAMKYKALTYSGQATDENSVPVDRPVFKESTSCIQSDSHAVIEFNEMLCSFRHVQQIKKECVEEIQKPMEENAISQPSFTLIPVNTTSFKEDISLASQPAIGLPSGTQIAVDATSFTEQISLTPQPTITTPQTVDQIDEMIRSVKVIQELQQQYTNVIEKTPDCELASGLSSSQSLSKPKVPVPLKKMIPSSFYIPLTTDTSKLVKGYPYSWVCPSCPSQFAYAPLLRTHLSSEHSYDDAYIDGKDFELRNDEPGEETYCFLCRVTFIDSETLETHLRQMHSEETEEQKIEIKKKKAQQYRCTQCGKILANRSSLADHTQADCGKNPQHECNVCGKKFHAKSTLKLHKTMHTGELPHSCTYCEKRFRTRGQLTVHTRTHTGEKPFPCKVCHQRFTHRETLISHLSRHIDMKRYKCYYCDMLFSCISALKAHRDIRQDTCGSIKLNARAIGPRVRVIKGTVLFEPQPEFNPRLLKKQQEINLRGLYNDHDYFLVEADQKKKKMSDGVRSEPSPMG